MTPFSRRAWLKSGVLAGAALGLPVLQRAAEAATRRGRSEPAVADADAAALTRSLLLGELNTSFVVWRGLARPVGLRLLQVGDTASAAAAGTVGSESCFSAIFEGATYAPLAQGTYTVTHAALGRLRLFLVPVGRPGRALMYEVSVNRLQA